MNRRLPSRREPDRPPQARESAPGAGPPMVDAVPLYEDEIDLADLWRVLWRRRWIIAGVFLFVVAAVGLYTWVATPVWEASSTIRVEEDRPGASSAAESFVLQLGPASQVETEMRVIETYPILSRVADDLDLVFRVGDPDEVPRDFLFSAVAFDRTTPEIEYRLTRTGEDRWTLASTEPDSVSVRREFAAGERVEIPGGAFTLATSAEMRAVGVEPPDRLELETGTFHRAVRDLREVLAVSRPDPEASLIRVRYEGTDRFLVRNVPNTVAAAFLDRRGEVQKTEARSTVAFLTEQNGRIETQLEAAENELQAFREEEQVVAPAAEAEAQVGRLAELRAERSQLSAERDALSNLLRQIDSESVDPDYRKLAAFPTFLANRAIQNLLETLTAAEQARIEMLSRRSENHPDVVARAEQIETLETQLGDIGRNYLQSLDDQIASIDAVLARFGSELEAVPGTEVQLARLQRRTEFLTEIHGLLQERLQEARIAEAVEDPSVRVVESAILPQEPISPRPLRNLALAGFLGLMLGVGLAFLREFTDRRIRSDEEVDEALGVPVLTRVPHLALESDYRGAESLVAHKAARSLPAEAYRTLRTNVRYTRGGEGVRELVVTSPGPGEGKSLTAGNLAITFAHQGQRTLLVDADMRKSSQHLAFEVAREPGLADVLAGRVSLEDAIHGTEIENLSLLTAGDAPPNPSELLGGDRMDDLLEVLRERWNAIVFDSPPVMAVTDATILGARLEGVLMVVRAEQTNRDTAEETVKQLHRIDANLIGLVFNDAKSNGHYGYQAYYGPDDAAPEPRWKRLLPFG